MKTFKKHRNSILLFGLCCSVVLLYTLVDPSKVDFLLQCPLYKVSGVYCPGCGSQRAFHHLLHGELVEALATNVLFIFALVGALYHFTVKRLHTLGMLRHQSVFEKKWGIRTVVVLILVFWILRNLQHPAVAWLAP